MVAKVEKPVVNVVTNDEKKDLLKLKNRFKQLEDEIAPLQEIKTKLEAALANPDIYGDKNKFIEAETAYKKATESWEKVNKEYEEVFEKIMELEN